jgi:hypothetical protein
LARIIFWAAEGPIADEQYAAAYALAEKYNVGLVPYGNSGGKALVHRFMVEGGPLRVVRFMRHIKAVFPRATI